jgi:hypothetical protein
VGRGSSLVVAGTVPQQITYQGQISQLGGAALSKGIYLIQARIWDNATGGNVMWGKAYPVNVDTNGSFNVNLGDGGGAITTNPAYDTLGPALDGGPRFLGITVVQTPAGSIGHQQEIQPRLQLVSSPCALRAGMADYALTWNGRIAGQLATLPASGSTFGSSAVVGYDGTNANAMPLTINSNPPGLTFSGVVTISGALLHDLNQVNVNTDFIYPKSSNGIALGSNVTLVGSSTVRQWGQPYTEATVGFLIVPWCWGPGGRGGSCYSQIWVTYLSGADPTTIVLYSGTTNASQMDSGYTLLPMPAGMRYEVDCGVRPNGPPGNIYFQSLGQ